MTNMINEIYHIQNPMIYDKYEHEISPMGFSGDSPRSKVLDFTPSGTSLGQPETPTVGMVFERKHRRFRDLSS